MIANSLSLFPIGWFCRVPMDEKGLYKGWNVKKKGPLDSRFQHEQKLMEPGSDKSNPVEPSRAAGTTDPASIRLKDITTSGFSAIVAKPPNTAVGDDSMTES